MIIDHKYTCIIFNKWYWNHYCEQDFLKNGAASFENIIALRRNGIYRMVHQKSSTPFFSFNK